MFALTVSEVGVDVQWCMCNCATPRMTFFLPVSFFFVAFSHLFFFAFRCNCLPHFFFSQPFFFFMYCSVDCRCCFCLAVLLTWRGRGGRKDTRLQLLLVTLLISSMFFCLHLISCSSSKAGGEALTQNRQQLTKQAQKSEARRRKKKKNNVIVATQAEQEDMKEEEGKPVTF